MIIKLYRNNGTGTPIPYCLEGLKTAGFDKARYTGSKLYNDEEVIYEKILFPSI